MRCGESFHNSAGCDRYQEYKRVLAQLDVMEFSSDENANLA